MNYSHRDQDPIGTAHAMIKTAEPSGVAIGPLTDDQRAVIAAQQNQEIADHRARAQYLDSLSVEGYLRYRGVRVRT